MSLPFRFSDLTSRFANVRPWAAKAVGSSLNRCAICMAYTLQIAPSTGDASIADIPGVKSTFTAAGPIKYGPSPTSAQSEEPLVGPTAAISLFAPRNCYHAYDVPSGSPMFGGGPTLSGNRSRAEKG